MWAHIFDNPGHWQWSTIAAFSAVAVALWAARSGVRERRQQIRQSTAIEVASQNTEWNRVVSTFLGLIEKAIEGAIGPEAVDNDEAIRIIGPAANLMDRALKSAHMVSTDFKLNVQLTKAHSNLGKFLELFFTPPPVEPAEAQRKRMQQKKDRGLAIADEFNEAVEAFLDRAFARYRLRIGLRYRFRSLRAIRAAQRARTQETQVLHEALAMDALFGNLTPPSARPSTGQRD